MSKKKDTPEPLCWDCADSDQDVKGLVDKARGRAKRMMVSPGDWPAIKAAASEFIAALDALSSLDAARIAVSQKTIRSIDPARSRRIDIMEHLTLMIDWRDLAKIKSLMIDVQEIITIGSIEAAWLKLPEARRMAAPRGVLYQHTKHQRLSELGLIEAKLVTHIGLPDHQGGRPILREMRATLTEKGLEAFSTIVSAVMPKTIIGTDIGEGDKTAVWEPPKEPTATD